jgi:diketogulonate reductase-like aldo/keto reductase
MRYETIDGLTLPKIGFGTWDIGGGSTADRSHDAANLAALRSALDLGYKHFDTAEMYGAGHTEELLGRAIRESGLPRGSLFIVSKVKPEHLRYKNVLASCEASLKRLQMDYLDCYLIHWPNPGIPLPDTFRALNKLVSDGKVRRLGVSNFDTHLIKRSEELSETPLLTDQVPYSVNDRTYVENGVLAYCRERGILFTAYSPVDQGTFKASGALNEIAQAHGATAQQIALAWLVAQADVITIPMSRNPEHQKQNLDAADIALSDEELARLG